MGETITRDELAEAMAELNGIAASRGIVWRQDESGAFDTSERTRYKAPGSGSGRGIVRAASAAQVKYMTHLFKTRDTSGLKILPGFNGVGNVSLAGARHLIDALLSCPELKAEESVPTVRMATEGQQRFISSLARQKTYEIDAATIPFDQVNDILAMLKALPTPAPMAVTVTGERAEIVSGMVYRVGDDVYRVQKSRQSGNLYALKLVGDDFEYAAGAIRLVEREGIQVGKDERAAYGKRTGRCMDCGRKLTVKLSVERGIGPICWNK